MWLFPWVNLFEKDLDLCDNRLNCSGDAPTACFGLHSRKNVIAIKIGIRLFLLHKAIDGDESELLNG